MAKTDRKFEKHFFWLAGHSTAFLDRCARIIAPGTYELPEETWYLQECLNFHQKYGTALTPEALRLILHERPENDKFNKEIAADLYHESDVPDPETIPFLLDYAEDRLRRRQTEVIMQNYADTIGDGNFEEVREVLKEGLEHLNTGTGIETYVDLFANLGHAFDEIAALYADDGTTISTGIDTVDAVMMGGARPGELCVYLAPPGHGKSQWLTYVARQAWLQGKNVAYLSFEMGEARVNQRFVAPLVATSVNDVPRLQRKSFAARLKRFRESKDLKNKFIVKRYPDKGATVSEINSFLDYLENRGTAIDVVVIDYGDIVAPEKQTGERRDDQAAVYAEMRNLAISRDVLVWTASQANRLSLKKKVITIEHLADSFDKAKTADYIIAQCQTPEEKRVKEARLYFAKCRYNGQGAQILVDVDFSYANFAENTVGSVAGMEVDDNDVVSPGSSLDSDGKSGLDEKAA